jgi:hypothetical protein
MRNTIDLIREAGFKEHNGLIYVTTINDDCAKEIESLVALVRADEREACAKVCYELPWKDMGHIPSNLAFAAAIRARGDK